MKILQAALRLLKEINTYGYAAYIVGGAVRDHLLDLDVYDIDIATSMPLNLLADKFMVIDNGSKYLSVTIEYEGYRFETTNFRKDIEYMNHRHPIVELVDSFEIDSNRRDFTINAMAYDCSLRLYDYHNGLEDLRKRSIKAINNPNVRFQEDALRILRALYLASKLDFDIEDTTLDAIVNNKNLLSELSNERLYSYFLRLIKLPYNKALTYIEKYDIFELIPEYKNWLYAYGSNLDEDQLCYSYYIKYRKYPPVITANQKRICNALDDIIDRSFSKYSLYKNKEVYIIIKQALKYLGYDVDNYDKIIESFPIKSDSELALSKENIVKDFNGKAKGEAIEMVLTAILEGKIKNTSEDIISILNRS